MTSSFSFSETLPYAHAALTYFELGWYPVPVKGKGRGAGNGPPTGFTGQHGVTPTSQHVEYWQESRGSDNVALRLPDGVAGLDVDAYGEKQGAATLEKLESVRGALPLTRVTTSRADGVSGIRLFAVPMGWRAPSVFGPGIEGISTFYRYAVVWPSLHPERHTRYEWYQQTSASWEKCDPPHVGSLPALPESWLSGWEHVSVPSAAGISDGEAVDISLMIREGAGPSGGQRHELLRLTQKLAGQRRSEDEAYAIWLAVLAKTPQDPSDPWTDEHFREFFESAVTKAEQSHAAWQLEMPSDVLMSWAHGVQLSRAQNGTQSAVENGIESDENSDRIPLLAHSEKDLADLMMPGMADWHGDGENGIMMPDLDETHEKLPRSDVEAATFLAQFLNGESVWSPIAGHWRWWDGVVFQYDGDSRADGVTRAFASSYKALMRAIRAVQIARLESEEPRPNETEAARRQRIRQTYEGIWGKHRSYRDRLHTHAGQSSLSSELKACVSRDERKFDEVPGLLAADNGMVSFTESGDAQLSRHSPTFLVTQRLGTGTRYDRLSHSPVLQHFLETSIPDSEQREFLQTVVGAAFTGTPWKGFLVLAGSGDSGKSTFASFLIRLLGTFSTSIDVDALAGTAPGNNEFRLANLRGRLLAVASEPSKGDRVNATIIKSLTGGDEQTTRAAYARTAVTWKPRCLVMVVTNHSLGFESSDEALMKRLGIIRFTQPPFLDQALPAKLDAEMTGALSWALEGSERWLRAGKTVTVPTSVLAARETMADDVDSCLRFVTEMLEEGFLVVQPEAVMSQCVTTGSLYADYVVWSSRENSACVGKKTFSQRLGRRYPVSHSGGRRFTALVREKPYLPSFS